LDADLFHQSRFTGASINFDVTKRTMGSTTQGNAAPVGLTGAALPDQERRTASATAAWAWTVGSH
jgi:hypothetical protein